MRPSPHRTIGPSIASPLRRCHERGTVRSAARRFARRDHEPASGVECLPWISTRRYATAFTSRSRKLLNFIRQTRPRVVSQLSECGGAGTGCGWCIPFLKQLHEQSVTGGAIDLETVTPEEYENRRAEYIRAGKGKPPPGATPLPPEEPVLAARLERTPRLLDSSTPRLLDSSTPRSQALLGNEKWEGERDVSSS